TSVEIGLWTDSDHRRQELLSHLGSESIRHRSVWTRFDKSTLHVSHSVQKIHYDGIDCLLVMAEDIDQETRDEQALRERVARTRDENAELERRVDRRTREMQAALDELESFTYSVSHDLRSPLRAIDGFASALADDHSQDLGATGNANIVRIRKASRRMSALIDDLLSLYRSSRVFVVRTEIDVTDLSRDLLQKLSVVHPERNVRWTVQEGMSIRADAVLAGIALDHLVQNAWKFTLRNPSPEIHIDSVVVDGASWVRIRDNGEGFDMAHSSKLFCTFHRLHDTPEFEGNGIGLAIVKRVVTRHGGRVEVDSHPGRGSEFRFCLDEGAP
ncbi:MAG: ATP-binding protein, partial [Fibrobacterota bacterium]